MADFLEPIKSGFDVLDAFKEGSKALQSISHTINRVLEPWNIRRNAEATSQAIEQVAGAIISSTARLREAETSEKAIENFQIAITYRQAKNLLEILEFIPEQEQLLLAEHPEQDSTFDPDNTNGTDFEDFFWRVVSASTFTGDTELQKLWAAVLVRGCYFSGSVSPKTLDVLRTMTRSDAELFSRYCEVSWQVVETEGNANFSEAIKQNKTLVMIDAHEHSEQFWTSASNSEREILESIGLIVEPVWRKMSPEKLTIKQFEKTLTIRANDILTSAHMHKRCLTRAGEELYPIAAKFNPEYFNAFEGFLRKKGLLI